MPSIDRLTHSFGFFGSDGCRTVLIDIDRRMDKKLLLLIIINNRSGRWKVVRGGVGAGEVKGEFVVY